VRLNIPTPTLCPDCRNKRRMAWRNDRTFYKANSALSNEPMISLYPSDTTYKIYLQSEWYGDKWDSLDYGRDFDFKRPFFEQFKELQLEVPRMNLDIVNCENSEYCNYCGDDKNCYLDIAGEANEDCFYNLFVKYSKNLIDCTFLYNSTLCYESLNSYDCYNVKFSQYCNNCSDLTFCFDCIGCKNCIGCYNLRNKEYYIFNEKTSKEEYESKLKEILNGSYKNLQNVIAFWKQHLKDNAIFRDIYQVSCENCSGNDLKNCKNVKEGYNVTNCWDCAYLYDVLDAKDCRDLNYSLYKPELSCELISTLNMTHSAFSMASHFCHEVFYCDQCNNSKNLFGCDGLNHKQYCILNKQYSKEEYETLKERIIEHMKETGEWGEFFPAAISPFGYNETVAQEYFPLKKDEALKCGYNWQDHEQISKVSNLQVVKASDLSDEIGREIPEYAIEGERNRRLFKIIKKEFDYYLNNGLPLPRKDPDQRHFDRLKLRETRKLSSRNCSSCGIEISSVYDNGRKEKVYCEKCYLKEIKGSEKMFWTHAFFNLFCVCV
ncbi:MAG: hypothetical protein WC269_02000, partial [Candidatus Gracilibacteria bacterium]